ncbi:hypothetical protein LSAT2_010364, partial [Lamellibrachia satsuma]
VKNGLQLVVNTEQYQYTKGPNNAVGLKFRLHNQGVIPMVQDIGDNVPAGMHTFVAVSVSNETNLPPPHGDCVRHRKLRYFSRYSQAACYRECVTDFVVDICGCRDYYMPPFNTDEPPVCNVSQYTRCLLPTIEPFKKNMAATCVCPKACGAMHYKASLSYAAANQNNQNRIDLSARFADEVGKNLNKSLNTQERLLPDRREANIDEAERVLRGLPILDKRDFDIDLEGIFDSLVPVARTIFDYGYNSVMALGFQKMQDALHDSFIVGWDEMKLHDCVSGSFELSTIFRDSVDTTRQNTWRAAIRLRLEEKLIASKRALYNLERVHIAYCNVVPLLHYTVTPNGRYDSFYLTAELFKQSTKINETYTRLIGHIK